MSKTVLHQGKMQRTEAEADFKLPSASDVFSAATNLIPRTGSVSGGRVLLGDKASLQAIALKHRETPLVQAAAHESGPSFEELYGKELKAITAKEAGKVVSVTEDEIQVKGTKTIKYPLYNNFSMGRKSLMHHYPVVGKGDEVKKGQILATSNYTDAEGRLALGVNLNTAIMPYRGYNFEDGFVLTESGQKKLVSEQVMTARVDTRLGTEVDKRRFVALFPNRYYNNQLQNIDQDGVIKKGAVVQPGDPLILAFTPKSLKSVDAYLGKLSKAMKHAYKDSSETWDYSAPGTVVAVSKNANGVAVNVKTERGIGPGDKLSMGYGAKGVTVKILPDSQAPTTPDGKPVDLLLNSMSITSRVAPGLVSTMALAKVAKKTGEQIKVTPFIEGSANTYAEEKLKEHGLSLKEQLYDPVTGRHIEASVAPLYINKLVHISEDKLSGRGEGVGYTANRQPGKVEGEESKRIGNLSTNALLSHHVPAVLEDMAVVKGTQNPEFWRRVKLGLPAPAPQTPFIFDKFIASLQGAGIKVNRKGTEFQLLPMTREDIEEMSKGKIETPETFLVKEQKIIPERGGLFDPAKTGVLGTNYNHIELAHEVVNPIAEEFVRLLLKLTKQQYEQQLISGELVKKLRATDVDKAITEAQNYIKSGKVSDRQKAVKVLTFLTTLKKTGKKLDSLILDKIPVIPAQFRPVQVAGDMTLSANVNHLYKDLLMSTMAIKNLDENVPQELHDKAKLEQYQAVKAVYGLADPINTKNKDRKVRGLLGEVLGIKGGSPKHSMFQAQVVNKPLDLVARGVAAGDATIDIDEIRAPRESLWKLYAPHVIGRLVKRGVPATMAKKYVDTRNQIATSALLDEMKHRPVILSRDPALHKHNLMGFFPKFHPDPNNNTIAVNPLVFKGFNLDLDGDQMNINLPASQEAAEEIKEVMLPSKNLLTVRNFSPSYIPSNEAALGLYQASTEKKEGKVRKFKTEDEVVKAFEQGLLNVDDKVVIG